MTGGNVAGAATPVVDLVIPTIGRPSLDVLFDVLTREAKAFDGRIVVVHDRPDASPSVWPRVPPPLEHRTVVLTGKGAGPAAARNVGWRAATAAWVAFLDDDVVPADGWGDALVDDLEGVDPGVAGVQGLIEVPLPLDRRPTDWERNVAGLETAAWATADMAYRRSVLEQVGGFDERFPRAYREDADLALRIMAVGGRLVSGQRHVRHPVGPTSPWTTVRRQAGNADDALMRAIHGRGWRHRVQAPRGRRRRHLATTALALGAVVATFAGGRRTARALATAWAGMTAEFAWTRIAPGPRTPGELATMVATSVAIPPAATAWWIRGFVRAWGAEPIRARGRVPRAVLFDRDGTLVVDVPYNGDPDRVVPAPGAKEAVERLRQAGVATAVISNQSGVARGLITADDVARVN
ncbi:MAG TPA: HAD-IIIA family hydrolase, partial [Acidimicrobiia bacterium]|nr:HAD-IIIA family hydrolase [Acidimicrobiia bacterium]